ncbi:MAG: PQQ-binding-like beta-propeller repeat protein, partial [Planctomycetes bacterium]|nr:PQQ-binding-like beta-propeller repeat protein [Planctomycetota bacterium]
MIVWSPSRVGRSRKRPSTAGVRALGLAALLVVAASAASPASDWPTYRCDVARSGVTAESLKPPLSQCWSFQPRHAPETAWGEPNPRPVGGWYGQTELRRVHFDDAFHVAVAKGAVYFGSSADGKVYSLDAKTGNRRWSALTGGPVRLAPTVWRDKVYTGSDDGFVYCLRASDGGEQWKFRAAPNDRKVLGSGKLVSLWPVRTGVLVDEGVAHFGAGIFPAEGVYMYAVGAEDGKLVWCNDTGGAAPQSRISPQGYLLASKDRLFAPLGRVSPAAFDRKDGRLLYESYFEHIIGGTYATLSGDQLFTGTEQLIGHDQASHRSRSSWFWGHQLVVTPDVFYVATGSEAFAVQREAYGAASLRRKGLLDRKRGLNTQLQRAKKGPEAQLKRLQADMDKLNEQLRQAEAGMAAGQKWRVPCDCAETLVLAGNVLLAGGAGKVVAFDATSGEQLWTGKIDGKARGLAVADGRLFVSADTGAIHCFGPQGAEDLGPIEQPAGASPPADEMTPVFEAAAEHIVRTTGIQRGHCLVLGCGTGRLALELAKRTELQICGIEPDPQKAQAARTTLDAAGLYGDRVLVELSQTALPDYFANLVVSEEAIVSGQMPGSAREAFRMLKPHGGTICIGQPAAANDKVKPLQKPAIEQWLAEAGIDPGRITEENGMWLDLRRGPLPGAGSWTHQYAEPGNTTCSDDQLVRCPLGVLWFGGPGPRQMAERHRRAAAPLATGGRLFILGEGAADRIGGGENSVMAYDAYNGLKLWERKIRGALRVSVTHDAGNSAANADSLFVAVDDKCLRFDAATGETKLTYTMPPAADGKPRRWGYVAVVGDALYGSRSAHGRTADCVFALDLASGKLRWKHECEGIGQGSIAIGDGQVFFAAASVTEEQRGEALAQQTKELHRMSQSERVEFEKKLKTAAVHRVVALEAATGDKRWEKPVEITGAVGGAYWCSLGAIYKRDVLVLFGVFLDGHYWKQFFAGQFNSRQVVALSGTDGGLLWRQPIGYRVRPIVIGDELHAEPWAYDLRTGKQKTRIHPVTGKEETWQFARPGHHCGCPAASPHTMLFRSYNLGWYDLEDDFGTQHFGAQRPGCWINFIPANGLLMMPEGSSGCLCPFPNTCTVVFKSREENRQWAYFSQPGPMTPVKRMALNLGAPGDRKDASGGLWFGYPRPGGSLVLQFKVGVSFFPGGSYFKHDPARLTIEGTDKPWVFRSGVRGLRQCTLPLSEPGDGTARYTVRLAFAELDHKAAGKRVFDIKLQGKVVAEGFDVFKEAGARNRAIEKEFRGIDAADELVVEFVPKAGSTAPDQLPILQGIEVEREKVLTLGFAVPSFLLNDAEPRQSGDVVIVNNKEREFAGTLRLDVPDRFAVTPVETPVRVLSGQRLTVALSALVSQKGPVGKHRVGVKLVAADGTVECEKETELEYLGDLQRAVLKVVEDTHAYQGSPAANLATSAALNVDGGDRKMGDHHHSIAYLKFRVAVGGKPVSAVLRLYNAGNPSGDSGQVRLVAEPWSEKSVTYQAQPKLGDVVAKIGPVVEDQIVELPLEVSLKDNQELSLAIDPTSSDGINYISREGGKPAELVVE